MLASTYKRSPHTNGALTPSLSMNRSSQIRMTNDEIRRNDKIRMTKSANAPLRVFRHSGFGFHSSFNDWCESGSWSQCMRKSERGLSMNRSQKKREQAPRTPNASRWNVARGFREAFGVRPACRRFAFRGSMRDGIRVSRSAVGAEGGVSRGEGVGVPGLKARIKVSAKSLPVRYALSAK